MELLHNCPHCGGPILIEQINCGIFRHGVYRNTGEQMNPHERKEECDRLLKENLIFGCGKPFRFDGQTISVCDYI